jgi:acetyl-CoA synthetase
MANDALENLATENRIYEPTKEFSSNANAQSSMYEEAKKDRIKFWENQALRLTWDKPWTTALDWSDAPFAKWFVGGKLNISYNCVDRHVEQGHGDQIAIYFEGEPGDTRTLTYQQLQDEVCKTTNALLELGVGFGDRVAIYLPMIPEAAFAMLACARIGAIHSVVFGGFSAEALRSRIDDAQAKLVITSDGGNRKGAVLPLKPAVDEAIKQTPCVEKVLVVKRTNNEVNWDKDKNVWWHEIVDKQSTTHKPESFDAETPLFILYTSGTTGKPKGILHTSGGYLTQAAFTHFNVFDLKADKDIYWCTADVGWITGHSYVVYGPLANRSTQLMYEGTPDTPHKGRFWELIQKYKVSILYTAPTAIRTFMKWGDDVPAQFDLSTLRVLGSVGEPINPEAWIWYREHIGSNRTPIVDTWWQTETGSIMISPLPGVSTCKPGSAMTALPGISAEVINEEGIPVGNGHGGYLALTEPWPSMLRGIWGDPERFKDTYWSRFPGKYFAGDGAKLDNDGCLWLLGRVDDVMNVSGHRISTTEVESALVSNSMVAEAAVVGANDELTGQAIVAFVILRQGSLEGPETVKELRNHVAKEIGAIAKPKKILIVAELPKTRSGKIMRRLLRDVAENRSLGDVTTLADPTVMNLIGQGLSTSSDSD